MRVEKKMRPSRQANGRNQKGKSILSRDAFWQLAIATFVLLSAFALPHLLYAGAAAQNGWC